MLIKTSTFKLNPECGFKKSYQTQFENDKLVKKSDTMQQQCPGKENGSHLGVSSLVPKLLQVFSYVSIGGPSLKTLANFQDS